jgi:hypothetical protein
MNRQLRCFIEKRLREETKDAKEMVLNKDIKEEYVKDYFK